MKRIAAISFLTLLWFHTSCEFQNPAHFELPTWRVNLTIPLLHEWYPLANIVNDSTILSSGDSIFVEFEGDLPRDSVNADYLQIPLEMHPSSASTYSAPSASDIFTGYQFSSSDIASDTIPIGATMESMGVINWAVFPPDTVHFPSDTLQKVDGASWNLVATAIEGLFGQTDVVDTLFDSKALFEDVPFVSEVLGLFIGGVASNNNFQSLFENVDMPMNIDSSWALLISGVDTLALHDTTSLAAADLQDKTSSLVGKALAEVVGLNFGFTLQRAASDQDTVIIPAGWEVNMVVSISMGIQDLDSAQVVVDSVSLMDAGDMEPVSFENASVSAEDCAVTGVYSGDFATGTPNAPKTNIIGISDVKSTFPFGINFGIEFENFVNTIGGDTATLKFQHSLTSQPYSEEQKLDGWSFINPDDPNPANPTIPLDSLIITPTVTTVPGTVSVALDGSEWVFSMGLDMYPLHFSSLKADLDCAFPPQTQEIAGIPQGFTGMVFPGVTLQFTMYNQIRLPLHLGLNLVGVGEMGDSVTVVVDAKLGTPASLGDTAKTIIELSSVGTVVKTFESASDTQFVSDTLFAGIETETIVDLLALNPSEIVVDAAAGIEGFGSLDENAAFWGTFRMLAPFSVVMEPMTFIPVTSTPMEEMPHETRHQIRNAVKSALMSTRIINGLPVGGELAILLADRDLFPLNRSREVLDAVRDSLGWPAGDSLYVVTSCSTLTPSNPDVYIFSVMSDSTDCVDGTAYLVRGVDGAPDTVYSFVDTLFKIVLLDPEALHTAQTGIPGMVSVPSDTSVPSELDTNKIALITGLGKHYINTRTHFDGTEGKTVFFSTRDTLEILSYLTFIFESTGFVEEAKDELVIVYPNGGDSLTVGEEVIIRWRALGEGISGDKVDLFISLIDEPDVADSTDWESITIGSIQYSDSTKEWSAPWTPQSSHAGNRKWLRICTKDRSVCDQSGWFFEIAAAGPRVAKFPGHGYENIRPVDEGDNVDRRNRIRSKKTVM